MATKKGKEEYKPRVPKRLFAIASPHSIGGVSMFDAAEKITADTVVNFFSEEQLINNAVIKLKQDIVSLIPYFQANLAAHRKAPTERRVGY